MKIDSFLNEIQRSLEELLAGQLPCGTFVDRFNDLMADEAPQDWDRTSPTYRLLDDCHTEFNLYVEKREWRAKHPNIYFGDEELRRKAQEVLDQLLHMRKSDG